MHQPRQCLLIASGSQPSMMPPKPKWLEVRCCKIDSLRGSDMNRRKALAVLGGSAGAMMGAGLFGRYALLPPSPSSRLAGVHDLAKDLYGSMDAAVRARACV